MALYPTERHYFYTLFTILVVKMNRMTYSDHFTIHVLATKIIQRIASKQFACEQHENNYSEY